MNRLPLYNLPSSTESRNTLSRTDSHLKFSFVSHSQLQKRKAKCVFRKISRKLIHAMNFVKELRSYAEQLKSQHMEYKYRHRNFFPLYPDDKIYIFWIVFIKGLHCIASIILPFQGVGTLLTQIISSIFAIDILFNFISCHIDEHNTLLHTFDKIIPYYIKGWFIVDLLSIIPFETYEITKMLGLMRLFRVAKYFMYERRENYHTTNDIIKKKEIVVNEDLFYRSDYNIDLRIRRIVTIFIDMIILTHIFACLWFWSARIDEFNQNTWAVRENVYDYNIGKQYVTCFYWAIQTVTVIGYGDIAAQTSFEFFLQIFWMLIGVGFYSFTIGDITCILVNVNPRQEYEDQLILLEELGDQTFMIEEILKELISFAKFNISHNPFWARNTIEMVQALPWSMRQYVIASTHKDILKIVPFIANDINFSAMVLPYCTLAKYDEYATIYHIGQSSSDFYYLLSGDVRLSDATGESIIRVMEGTVFGEVESIEQTLRRWHAHAVTKSVVLMCPGRFFESLIKQNSTQFFELFQMYKRRKILLSDYAEQKQRQAVRLKRSTAIIIEGKVVKTQEVRRSSENRQQFKSKIDCRNYISVQQDLMLSVVGQKQARKKLLREKFRLAVERIKQMLVRTKKRRSTFTIDQDYKIIRELVATRSQQTIQTQMFETNNQLKKLMHKFGQVVEQENQVQSFIIKKKQESYEKIKRKKLKDLVAKWNHNKRRKSIKREIDLYYSSFHTQIYQELLQTRIDQKQKIKQKQENIRKNSVQQLKLLNLNVNYLIQQAMKFSIHKFEIMKLEREIDLIIDECQSIVQQII
ncbi:unnamed protein product (macronuclear) [Paramecium tetraurelia]|uniref:Cyclic nucleotide-binding domain-containing protein n=1 Tax=Paramecium tetraurelia TaxID=5888 RepID=A0BM55_PARTE|nr:uncharacterized protein GSPATT00030256001 [Paramecium tetraurelia]CAK59622.1 unnamed protein product [Paramecium tetraurelia]|eukprot:XP_001427020.1 hypothetical protein (macronuclear) [Paramecium tetraurelia strain d4-2]